jgi:hypothetical protein
MQRQILSVAFSFVPTKARRYPQQLKGASNSKDPSAAIAGNQQQLEAIRSNCRHQ